MKDNYMDIKLVVEEVLKDSKLWHLSIETLTDYLVDIIIDKVIPKDSVVLSMEEYEKYMGFKKRVDGAKFFEIIENERKETAEKILKEFEYCNDTTFFSKWLQLCKEFGVEIKEVYDEKEDV